MNLELTDEQAQVVRQALEDYLSDLRAEIVKTEKHAWKVDLHKQQEALEAVLDKLK